ncbi:type II toxin-antitoxin system RelE/ParE family toxin [Candidatus Micrarchaeota archaeon]|nr:type II toxin-antitoxin system RelE/ParE family toxin [Candidatus Micrarchaeota archaeon]
MTYGLEVLPSCKKEIESLCRKNSALQGALNKKLLQVLENPHHFKPLSYPLQNKRRVHIMKSFVLLYEVNEKTKMVTLTSFSHHDDAY